MGIMVSVREFFLADTIGFARAFTNTRFLDLIQGCGLV